VVFFPGVNRLMVVFLNCSLSLSLFLSLPLSLFLSLFPSLSLSLSLSLYALALVWRLASLSLFLSRCLSLDFRLGARDSEGVVADLPRR
jgi:hypothetical protein